MANGNIRSDYYDLLNVGEHAGDGLIEINARKLLARFADDAEKAGAEVQNKTRKRFSPGAIKESEEARQRAWQRCDNVIEAFAVLTHPDLRKAYDTGGFGEVAAIAETLAAARQAAIQHLKKPQLTDVNPLVFRDVSPVPQPSATLPPGVTRFEYREPSSPR